MWSLETTKRRQRQVRNQLLRRAERERRLGRYLRLRSLGWDAESAFSEAYANTVEYERRASSKRRALVL